MKAMGLPVPVFCYYDEYKVDGICNIFQTSVLLDPQKTQPNLFSLSTFTVSMAFAWYICVCGYSVCVSDNGERCVSRVVIKSRSAAVKHGASRGGNGY